MDDCDLLPGVVGAVTLKLGHPFGWSSWRPTWRLLGIAMPVTIVVTGLLGWWFLGLASSPWPSRSVSWRAVPWAG